eukprot:CAMPEP_0202690298 /NCGR_PEP_ID=MMETSP1385-20130828/5314_1 /ASSEMBLY_ACC=CAM_ASM_000861 /TAXON_ID=933848 /ORGANISM="Elphidium margaritaceum" /LENGTH=349 /DNA_ID=CAMNT_0049345535 /DNA_START=15 /DNA_END=1061 /DNA_ORIENTATION=-
MNVLPWIFLVALIVLTQSASQTEQAKAKPAADTKNYDSIIQDIQSQLEKMVDQDAFKKIGEKLNALSGQLKAYDARTKQQSDELRAVNAALGDEKSALKAMSERIEKMESSTSSSSSKAGDTAAVPKAVHREIENNAKSIKLVQDTVNNVNLQQMKDELKEMSSALKAANKAQETALKQIGDRFNQVDQNMADYTKNLQFVYDSTISAILGQAGAYLVDKLTVLGEWCVQQALVAYDKVSSIPWKTYVEKVTDKKQQQLFLDWIKEIVEYVRFWWNEGVKPAIITQALQTYEMVQTGVKRAYEFVHAHVLYLELTMQAKPYLELANIPAEFHGKVIDAVLVLFTLSSLW